MADLQALKIERGQCKSKITRLRTFLESIDESNVDDLIIKQLQSRLDSVETVLNEFYSLQKQIDVLNNAEDLQECANFENSYFDIISKVKNILDKYKTNTNSASSDNLNLPPIKLGTFSVEMLVNILRFLDDKSLLNAAFSSKRFMRICKEDPLLRRRIRSYIRKEKQLIKQSTVNAKLQLEIIRHDQPQLFGKNQNKIVTVKKLNCLRFSSTAQPIAKHFAVSEPDNRPSGGGKLRTKCKDRLVPYKVIRF
ncbi:hypothetical protein RN001_005458 [Aquatica leii]|uniref:F-box domain-containing protein n=1 Tax=Aquatica leii TaxID=1421715 RepID=A0AAN7Q0E8_9COLE|nr:hypothetical protein RN001_005458 [Aquatica leii]